MNTSNLSNLAKRENHYKETMGHLHSLYYWLDRLDRLDNKCVKACIYSALRFRPTSRFRAFSRWAGWTLCQPFDYNSVSTKACNRVKPAVSARHARWNTTRYRQSRSAVAKLDAVLYTARGAVYRYRVWRAEPVRPRRVMRRVLYGDDVGNGKHEHGEVLSMLGRGELE